MIDLPSPPIPYRPDWHDRAACKGMDPGIFFPPSGGDSTRAKRICADCPVKEPCRAWGMHEADGVWGGLSRSQRARMRRGGTRVLACRICDAEFVAAVKGGMRERYCSVQCKQEAGRRQSKEERARKTLGQIA